NNILYALDGDNGLMAFTISSVGANPLAPTITLQPLSQVAVIGSNVTFRAAADGDTPLNYQWRFKSSTNGSTTVEVPGATNREYALTAVQLTNSGGYSVVVTNVHGAITSYVANMKVVSR